MFNENLYVNQLDNDSYILTYLYKIKQNNTAKK